MYDAFIANYLIWFDYRVLRNQGQASCLTVRGCVCFLRKSQQLTLQWAQQRRCDVLLQDKSEKPGKETR